MDPTGAQRVALDALVRRIREPGPAPGASVRLDGPTVRVRRWLPPVALAVGLVVVGLLVPQLRRPQPADRSLPRADATTSSVDPTGGDPTSRGPGPPGPSSSTTPAPSGEIVVHVVGGVARPGVLRLDAGARAVDAVELAGGLVPLADSARVNLAAPLVDGQRLVVPLVGQEPPREVQPSPGGVPVAGGGSGATVATGPAGPLDLNRASEAELDELPGIGPSTATAIVEHRTAVGPFRSVEDLLDVRGIGTAKLDAVRDLVTVG